MYWDHKESFEITIERIANIYGITLVQQNGSNDKDELNESDGYDFDIEQSDSEQNSSNDPIIHNQLESENI